jgi:hypothetical protein
MGKQKSLPIGVSDFKKLIERGCRYVDKTLFIQELMSKGDDVFLIPRPRRFGKTLNLSMLHYFFEKTSTKHSYLFKGLKIWKDKKYRALQGQFPVIFITLKDTKQSSWKEMFSALCGLIADEFRRHRYLFESDILSAEEKEMYQKIVAEKATDLLVERSLKLLMMWLYRFHQKRVILLIDEYDAPTHTAYLEGFYGEQIAFLRNWLSGALKDNPALERGVITGILRVAKESIFSGMNNVKTVTILSDDFQDKFGLTEKEVKELLKEYKLSNRWDGIRKWYNGYRMGSLDGIYNPWSVLNSISQNGALFPYWVNTSDNLLIKQLMTKAPDDLKIDLELLMKGEVIDRTIDEAITFTHLNDNSKAIWSLLLFSGYLSLAGEVAFGKPVKLRIPNAEVKQVYQSMILGWFETTIHELKYKSMLQSLVTGDIKTFSSIFQEFLLVSFSSFDIPVGESEKIYHAFVLGMLVGLKDRYEVKSNRESGHGRYDVMLIPKDKEDLGLVIEFKKISSFEKTSLKAAALSALKQIKERKYDLELKSRKVKRILHIAMAFKGKNVLIRASKGKAGRK